MHRHWPSSQTLARRFFRRPEDACSDPPPESMELLFLTEHLGHLPVCRFGGAEENLCCEASLVAVTLSAVSNSAKSVLPRQQHEIPPKIWLVATANSKTTWKGIRDIGLLLLVRFSDRLRLNATVFWMLLRLLSFTIDRNFRQFSLDASYSLRFYGKGRSYIASSVGQVSTSIVNTLACHP